MSDTNAPAAGSESTARDEGLHSVADAVAELERRERERAAATRAKNKAQAEPDASDDDEPPTRRRAKADADIEDADAEEDDGKPAKRKDDKPAKQRASSAEDDDSEDDTDEDAQDDDAEEGDDDQQDDTKAKDDADESDETEADDEDDKAEAKKTEPQRFKVKLNGREVETTPEEVSEYLTESHAERQRATQAREVATQQMQQIQQHAATLSQIAQMMLGTEPDLQLAQSDPGTYIAQQAQYRHRLAVLQQVQKLGADAQARQAEQQQQAFGEFAQRERQALLRAMPELADPDKLAAFKGRAVKVAQRYGISPDELGNQFDHRSFLMLRDLSRLHDMEAERAKTRKQLKAAPQLRAPEPGAAVGQRQGAKTKDRDALKSFLKSNRSMRDVKAYLARTER